jgi:rubrerythrin
MDNETTRIAEALKKAMQAENEGYHFYLMAASNTDDPKGKETFQYLADEEKNHFNFLKGQYNAFLKTGQADSSIKLGASKELTGSHPIFSDDIKNRIGGAHYEMTVLSIGIQLELSAVNFYQAEADAASDNPAVKIFFNELADWERGHLKALQDQSEALKEDYWNKGGFSPF